MYDCYYVLYYWIGGYYGYYNNMIIIGDYDYWGFYDLLYGYYWVYDYDSGDVIFVLIVIGVIIGFVIGVLVD